MTVLPPEFPQIWYTYAQKWANHSSSSGHWPQFSSAHMEVLLLNHLLQFHETTFVNGADGSCGLLRICCFPADHVWKNQPSWINQSLQKRERDWKQNKMVYQLSAFSKRDSVFCSAWCSWPPSRGYLSMFYRWTNDMAILGNYFYS